MVGGNRWDEAEAPVGARPRRRLLWAALVVTAIGLVIVIPSLFPDRFSEYPKGGCKGVGIAGPILNAAEVPEDQLPELAATPEEAIARFAAAEGRTMNGDPFPLDGWHEYRGRWVRDMPDGSYLALGVQETPRGWAIGGDSSVCSR